MGFLKLKILDYVLPFFSLIFPEWCDLMFSNLDSVSQVLDSSSCHPQIWSDALLRLLTYKSLTELQSRAGRSTEPGDTPQFFAKNSPSTAVETSTDKSTDMPLMLLFSTRFTVSVNLDLHQDFSSRYLVSHSQYPPFPCLKETAFSQIYISFSGPSPRLHTSRRVVECNSALTPASSHGTLGCNLSGIGDQILFILALFSDYCLNLIGVNCLLTILCSAPLQDEDH